MRTPDRNRPRPGINATSRTRDQPANAVKQRGKRDGELPQGMLDLKQYRMAEGEMLARRLLLPGAC
ncbi:hypothetical protein ACIBB8_36180, partial [Streptomyces sp. NPDC051286]